MKEAVIKVTLSEGSFFLKEWEQLCHTDLPKLYETLKLMKLSINDYLTQLVYLNKNFVLSNQMEATDYSEVVEEIKDDDISGFIKHVNNIYMIPGQHEERKCSFQDLAKKFRK